MFESKYPDHILSRINTIVLTDAERLASLFKGSIRAHGHYSEPEKETKPTGIKWNIRNSARIIHKPPTLDLFEKHLQGEYPLGIIPILDDGTCFWGSIDVDDYAINPLSIINKIENGGFPLVPCLSKSGGLHLFIFLTDNQPCGLVIDVLKHFAAKLGLSNSEIFPKQTEVLVERGDVGNWLAIPLLGTTFNGKLSEQTAIKKTGAKLTTEEFLDLAERSKISSVKLRSYEDEIDKKAPSFLDSHKNESKKDEVPFLDGPPCLQHLSEQGIPDGGRNSTLFMMALYYIRKDESNWRLLLEEANRRFFQPPLPSDEVTNVIKSVEKKGARSGEDGYRYTCKTQPMASHCNSKLCRGRPHGIGSAEETPRLSGISKLNTEPPIWFINVGDMRIEATTDQLQNYFRFHMLCMEKGNICFRAMKQQDWLTVLGDAMQHDITIIDVSDEVGIRGQFKELLDDFLTDRQIAEDKEELLRNLPWKDIENGKIYFRLQALHSFLERNNFRAYNRSRLAQRIRDLGGNNHFFNLKSRGIHVWWIPLDILPGKIIYTVPELQKTPI